MASPHPPGPPSSGRAGQLWQFPLLTLSVGLFGYAAYVFIDPKPGPTVDQKIDVALSFLKAERPEAAIDQLNGLLATQRLDREHEGQVHTLLAQSLDELQTLRHLNLRTYREQVIDQTRMAAEAGARPTPESERRLGEAYEALAQPTAALAHYRSAMAMDPTHELRLQRKVIDLQLAQNEVGPATASIDAYLKSPGLTDRERAWAMCNRAKLLVDAGEYVRARTILDEVLKLDADPSSHGQANYYLGYCAYKLGDLDGAAALLRLARQLLRSDHPLDANAAYLLGQVCEAKRDPATAESFYRNVLSDHPGCDLTEAALLGRGLCRVQTGHDDAGLADLSDLTRQLLAGRGRPTDRPDAVAGIGHASAILAARGNYRGAVELLDDEQQLEGKPTASLYRRLADVYEQRAVELDHPSAATDETAADPIRRGRQARAYYTKAGDASVAYAAAVTATDDREYGTALWRGTKLYDRAGNVPAATSALELFVAQRPTDPLAPEALLRLGNAYRAAGQFDRAIDAFQRNLSAYPNSLAAGRSAVPLAQAYLAKGPDAYDQAEHVLRGVVENNPLLTPAAEEFKQALFELATLYYRTGRYDEAIGRLREMTARYAADERTGQLLFLTADSYRKGAALLAAKPAAVGKVVPPTADATVEAANRKDRLTRAQEAYGRVVAFYKAAAPATDLDALYDKLSHFYEADCAYDLGDYPTAVGLYDQAASRFPNDASALTACVQIVNADNAMGKPDAARVANERAKIILKRMPAEAFTGGAFALSKEYWENQLKWSTQAGLW